LKERAQLERRRLVLVDDSSFSSLPGVVKTYGVQGEMSIRDRGQTYDHL
jgi:hypothetical protein